MNINDDTRVFNEKDFLFLYQPPPPWTKEDILGKKAPNRLEIGFWIQGDKSKAVRMYKKRAKLPIELASWIFFTESFYINNQKNNLEEMVKEELKLLGIDPKQIFGDDNEDPLK